MKYEEYKQVNIGWVNEIPMNWDVIPIKYTVSNPALSFIDGDWIESKVIEADGIRYLTTGNVGALSYKEQGTGFISEKTFAEINCTEVFPGDILISRLNEPIARACIVPDLGYRIVVAVDNVIYRPISQLYDRRFVMYQMNCFPYAENASFIARGSTMPRISRTMLGAIKLCIPPLPVQQVIADYLDVKCGEINRAIDVQRKKIDLLNELKQTVITDAVTKGLNPNAPMKNSGVEWIGEVPEHWEVRKLKYLCRQEKYSIKTGPFGSQLKGEDLKEEGDVRVYNQRNVLDNNFEDTKYFVTSNKAKLLKSFYTLPNDILLTSRGTIGKAALLPKGKIMGLLHPCLIAIRINKCIINPHYLLYYINEFKGFNTAIQLASNSTTIEVIYTDTIKNVLITLPSIQEQQAIVAHIEKEVSKIDTQISKANRKIELLDELKQSIITEAVTGKIKVFN